jgi:hypothetical protein
MSETRAPYWTARDQLYVVDGLAYGVTDDGDTICLGKADEVLVMFRGETPIVGIGKTRQMLIEEMREGGTIGQIDTTDLRLGVRRRRSVQAARSHKGRPGGTTATQEPANSIPKSDETIVLSGGHHGVVEVPAKRRLASTSGQ